MSKKQWFILRVDHHLGPFSHEELIDLYERAKLREVDQLWREGMNDWKPFDQIEEFAHLLTPPPLPTLPEGEEELVPPLPDEEEPPPLPPLPGDEAEDQADAESQEQGTLEEIIHEQESSEGPSRLKWVVSACLCVLVLSVGLMVLFNRPSSQAQFYEMRVPKAQEMKSFLRENKGMFDAKNMPFALGLSRDSQSLVLASPYPASAKLFLRLESIEGKGLFSAPVIMTSSAQLKNHKAVFEDITWERGRRLVPGFYRYEISAIPTGVSAQLRSALQRVGMAQDAPRPFQGSGEVLLSRWEHSEFEKRWIKFQRENLFEKMKPLEERLQRYQTLEALATQILELYREILPQVRRPKDMHLFEQRYAREIAALLQELIIEAHKKALRLSRDEDEKPHGLELLRDFGKEVAALVSDMVTTTQETPGLNDTKKERLIRLFEMRVESLALEAKKRQDSIRGQIQKMRTQLKE